MESEGVIVDRVELRRFIKSIPIAGDVAAALHRKFNGREPFTNSTDYWERRYATGGNSGVGSYAELADFKATVLNEFVREHSIQHVIEFGCGDGNQLSLAQYPSYSGYDASPSAVELCRKRFALDPTKTFGTVGDYKGEKADLVLSLDVVFHLVEDRIFESYMRGLFAASTRYTIIYSSDIEGKRDAPHVRHRKFSKWVSENIAHWKLTQWIPNRYPDRGEPAKGSLSDFFIYQGV